MEINTSRATVHKVNSVAETKTLHKEPVVTVQSMTHDGDGVARLDGKAILVRGAIPGETVRIRYVRRRKNYDTAELSEILEPSPNRTVPPCNYFGTCGGCDLQHLQTDAQLDAKQHIVAEQLARLGKVKPDSWLKPISGPTLGYRRRARLGVRWISDEEGVVIGFRQKNKSFLLNLDTCLVLHHTVSEKLPHLRKLVSNLSCPDRIPQIEIAVGDKTTAMVFRHLVPLTEADRKQLMDFGQVHNLTIYLQPGRPDSIHALWPSQPDPLYYSIPSFDVNIQFEPSDFIQINDEVNKAMVAQALALLDLVPNDRVLDLFCGLGNFTLPLARKAGHVMGIEGDAELIERAKNNADLNGIRNVEFRQADLYRKTHDPAWNDFTPNKLLLDPPRGGAMDVIKNLSEPFPSRIVYVSCYPATLARDSEFLVHALGYQFVAAGIMDMFPQTSHIETMALFTKV